jgi:DNA-binding transcriptional MerR regulator
MLDPHVASYLKVRAIVWGEGMSKIYTVKKIADISGISVRTLHHYDEIGLFSPSCVGENGYRYYQERDVLKLQQILFFRELGFKLKDISYMLIGQDFDHVIALKSHREALLMKNQRILQLVNTIDQTINKLNGVKEMTDKEMFEGFDPATQSEYEKYLVNRYGEKAKAAIVASKEKTRNWGPEDIRKNNEEWRLLLASLAQAMRNNVSVSSNEVQALVKQHFDMVKRHWTPDRDSYTGLAESYTEFIWADAFKSQDDKHPKLAQYLAEAMTVYAEKNLK